MQTAPTKKTATQEPESISKPLSSLYVKLFHEMQFRATRNALMNFYEADELKKKGKLFKMFTNTLTAATASGLFAWIAKGGKIVTNKAGLAGAIGLPICSVVKFFEQSTSDLLPSYDHKAKKHITAAAGWAGLAEIARVERMRISIEPARDVKELAGVYGDLVQKKVAIASEVMIPQETHYYFSRHPEIVVKTVERRSDMYRQFQELQAENLPPPKEDDKPVNVFYF